ncbi:MAG: hypothetical protein JXJ17_18370 [Anaerolineae bacterium]|nr:hypothetical protein [Anaerolineae bacterium]
MDKQTLTLDAPYEAFFLWHRSVIPVEYRLYLFHESSSDSMELKPATKLEDLHKYLGRS